jgi:hypothetical protein
VNTTRAVTAPTEFALSPAAHPCEISLIKVPFHRSPLFLIGLFPVVILLWAWADSVTANTVWARKLGGGITVPGQPGLTIHHCTFNIGISQSRLRIGTITRTDHHSVTAALPPSPYGGFTRFPLSPRSTFALRQFFPGIERENGARKGRPPGFDFQLLHLPFWFLLACYLPLWLAASRWHARVKQQRHLASLPSPPSPPAPSPP